MPKTVCLPFKNETLGGSHVSTSLLVEALVQSEYKPLVLLHQENGAFSDYLKQNGIPYQTLPIDFFPAGITDIAKHPVEYIAQSIKIIRFIWQNDIAIVQTNDWLMHFLWCVPCAFTKAKLLHYQRTLIPALTKSLDFAFALTNRIVCNSQAAAKIFVAKNRKIEVARLPFKTFPQPDKEQSKTDFCEKHNLDKTKTYIGYMANLHERKRPLLFVDIAKNALHSTKDNAVCFLMAGTAYDDFEERVRERIKSYGLSDRIIYLGPTNEPNAFLSACDIFVAPARNEAAGRTLQESMLAGTVVVASNEAGHMETITSPDMGILAEPDSVQAFSDAIISLLENPEKREAIATKARETIVSEYSVEKHKQQMIALYDDLLKQRTRII